MATITNPDELENALDWMATCLGDSMTAHDAGIHFTCTEAESIAAVLNAAGHTDAATTWLEGHAAGDDEGDMHHPDYNEEDGQ